jgi:uncharacterized protein (TIGR02001 family)
MCCLPAAIEESTQLYRVVMMTLLLLASPFHTATAAAFGGSLGITSDYLIRGISRTHHHGSLQADAHIALENGVDAGVFAASVVIGPDQHRDAELSAFAGFAAEVSAAWHARTAVNHYSYPGNSAGSKYDYDELSLDVTYQEWLTVSAVYSPNAPRLMTEKGVIGVTARSAELSAQTPLSRQFFLTGGVGYAHLAGRYPGGYAYWSAGGIYSPGPVSISLQYVSTTSAAERIYYDAAAHNRLTGSVIWRF